VTDEHRTVRVLASVLLRIVAAAALLIAIAYLLVLRNMYYKPSMHERSSVGSNWINQGFSVAVVWPPHTDLSLVEGVTLAHEELDAGKTALAGKINLRFYTEASDRGALARDIVKNRDVVAVIGHELSGNTIPASLTYEQHGVLYLSPKETDLRLTSHKFSYVFRLTPDDGVITRALAQFAIEQDWKKVGVLYGRIDHGESASGQFLSTARRLDLEVPFFQSYLEERNWVGQDFRPMVAALRNHEFDAVFLADQLPWAAKLLVDMARMGLNQPVLATDKLDSLQLWQIAQVGSNNVYVASAVDPTSTVPAYRSFRERFRARFGKEPGYGASQGYESFTLFANACLLSQSADPIVVATTLRTATWTGLFGPFSFGPDGDVLGRSISIKRMQNGTFETVTSMKIAEMRQEQKEQQ
jgi:branched-chain amino acid transport system substrate-binding protein